MRAAASRAATPGWARVPRCHVSREKDAQGRVGDTLLRDEAGLRPAAERDDRNLGARTNSKRNPPEPRAGMNVEQRRTSRDRAHGVVEEKAGEAPLERGKRELPPVRVTAQRKVNAAVGERGPQ